MPSTRSLAVALTAMVLLAGCSMLPVDGGGQSEPATDSPGYHGFGLVADTDGASFEATVTVTKNETRLLQESVSLDGDGTYTNLSAVTQPGPYTVTVQTTIPAADGGTRDYRRRVDGALGDETILDVVYNGLSVHTLPLPRQAVTEPVYLDKDEELPVETTVVIHHRGDVVYAGGVPQGETGLLELTTLSDTGVYRVSLSGLNGERWTNKTVVVSHAGSKLYLHSSVGRPSDIEVYPPNERLPD
jgi:hypothetical protein